MPLPTLPRTKFLIPRRTVGAMPRPHLVALLEQHTDKRLILVSTPPGYGKTTLLAEFARVNTQPTTWCQLDAADSDPIIFLNSLLESLRQIDAGRDQTGRGPGAAAMSLLKEADTAAPARVLAVLINELVECIANNWLVILEDYHEITNPAVHALVDQLLENAPPGLTLVISTRSDPPLSLARLRARGMLAELRSSDLRFTEKEALAWLRTRLPMIADDEARILIEKAEGWAAGLQLILSSLSGSQPADFTRIVSTLDGTNHYIFEFLVSEVFQRQSPTTQMFLLHSAVLPLMNAEMCNALPGIEDAQAVFDHLVRQNLFISRLDEDNEWHRYHPLFRDFLLDKLHRDDPDRYRALFLAAGRHYEEINELEAALQSYLRGMAFEQAAQVLERLAPRYIELGRLVVLQRYFSQLPTELFSRHPQLLLFHGDVLRRLGHPMPAVSRYEEALHAFESQSDPGLITCTLVRLGELARIQGDYQRAETLVSQALAQAQADDHVNRAGALIALAKSKGFLTGMDQGRALAEQALAEARLAGEAMSPLARANLLRSLGQICWWHGDPQSTVRYCKEALQTAPEELSPTAARACISLATPYLYWRQLDTAMDYAERGLEIAQQLQLNELLPSAYTTLGNVLTRRGEIARAESALRQALDIAQRLGLAVYERVMATGYLAYNLYGQGRIDEAWQLAEGVLWSYTGNIDTYEVFVCRSVLADIALERDQFDIAERLFTDLMEVGERRQFRIPLAMVYFGLAYIHLTTQRTDSGVTLARRSLALIEPTNALQLYLDQGERAVVVCQALTESGAQSLFLSQALADRPVSGAIAFEHPRFPTVSVKSMGEFRVIVDGEEIRQDRWVSAKARDLLTFFVTFRHEHLTADRLIEALWPDTGMHAKRALPTALYRLRQALRTEGQSTKYVVVEAGEYWLDTARFQIDVDEFDTALAQARAAEKLSPTDAALWFERALSYYEGEYLTNLYYDWVFPERRRLQRTVLSALNHLGDLKMAAGVYEQALAAYERSLGIDLLQEQVHCEVMRCYAALGDRISIARQYQLLHEAMLEDLGAPPLATTTALYETLLASEVRVARR